MFKVSVITPVYNAEIYLRKAVESAVILGEVGEVILIEDASPDNALAVALELEQEFEKVKLFQHPDKGNHGAGASRNLGIHKASCDYIAFLDADDYYLPNRFKSDKAVFLDNPDAHGVYNAIGIHYYSDRAKQQFLSAGFGYQAFLTLTNPVPPEELFSVLFYKHPKVSGEFSTIAITVKKEIFNIIGHFNTTLRLQQDVHLWKRMAAFCNLYAGNLKEPVAVRGVHEHNRMTVKEDHHQYIELWWKSLNQEFKSNHLETSKYNIFEQAYFNYVTAQPNKLKALLAFIENVVKQPKIIKEAYGDFDFNFWKVFGKNWLTLRIISVKNKVLAQKMNLL